MAALSAKMAKIEEARIKTDEQEKLFIQQTEEALKTKIAKNEENRETHINDLKAKMKKHVSIEHFVLMKCSRKPESKKNPKYLCHWR